MKRKTQYAVTGALLTAFMAVLLAGCGSELSRLSLGEPARSSAEQSDLLKQAFVATVELLDGYVAKGLVTGTETERIWETGEVLRDYTDFRAVDGQAEAALMRETEELQRQILGDTLYEQLTSEPVPRGAVDWDFDFSVPGLGEQQLYIEGFGYLLFWHRYWLQWENTNHQEIDDVIFKLHDTNSQAWVKWGGTAHLWLEDASEYYDGEWSDILAGFRNQFIGLDDLKVSFYDPLVTGGSYTWDGI